MDRKRFWAPVHEEMRKDMIWVFIIGALGITPATYFGRMFDSFWLTEAFILGWFLVVFIVYLTILYIKNK